MNYFDAQAHVHTRIQNKIENSVLLLYTVVLQFSNWIIHLLSAFEMSLPKFVSPKSPTLAHIKNQ